METTARQIIIAEPDDYSQAALDSYASIGKVLLGPFSTSELKQLCTKSQVLVLRLGHVISTEFLENTSLKYIITPTTGLDHIDVDAAQEKGIQIISLKGESSFLASIPSTAQHTWALLLSLVRKIPDAFKDVLDGRWNRDSFKSRNLDQLHLGILGYGRVGKQVAHYAQAFNMSWSFYDIDESLHTHPNFLQRNEFFNKLDILSIHIPLNDKTLNIIGEKELEKIGSHVYIVNTSRGKVVDESVILNNLENGKIIGYATDVLASELDFKNTQENTLVQYAQQHNNIIITPHIAGATIDSMHMTEDYVAGLFKQKLYSE